MEAGDENEEDEEEDFLVTKGDVEVDDADAKKYRDFLLQQAGGEQGVREILGMGGFPERMIQQQQQQQQQRPTGGKEEVQLEGEEQEQEGKRVRTKDDDEEFLMKYVPVHPGPA